MEAPNPIRLSGLPAAGVVDRPMSCARCGYELAGQIVRSDPHYGLHLIACPECGTVASVSPGPRVGAPPRTWLRIIAAAVLLIGVAGLIGGLAQSTGFAAAATLARFIGSTVIGRPSVFARVEAEWWDRHSGNVLSMARANGVGWDWAVLTDLLWLLLFVPPAAVALALVLPGLRQRGLLALGALAALGAVVGVVLYYAATYRAFGWEYSMKLAEWAGGQWFGAATVAAGTGILAVSLVIARPAARAIVRRVVGVPESGQLARLWAGDRSVGVGEPGNA